MRDDRGSGRNFRRGPCQQDSSQAGGVGPRGSVWQPLGRRIWPTRRGDADGGGRQRIRLPSIVVEWPKQSRAGKVQLEAQHRNARPRWLRRAPPVFLFGRLRGAKTARAPGGDLMIGIATLRLRFMPFVEPGLRRAAFGCGDQQARCRLRARFYCTYLAEPEALEEKLSPRSCPGAGFHAWSGRRSRICGAGRCRRCVRREGGCAGPFTVPSTHAGGGGNSVLRQDLERASGKRMIRGFN